LIQVYTGNGKGKTTASLGLALRASGAGLKVFIGQFLKGRAYSELSALKKIKNIRIEQFGNNHFIRQKPSPKDKESAAKGLERISEVILGGSYEMVIMDEVNVAIAFGLLRAEDVIKIIRNTPARIELVLTGRYAKPGILKIADLISEIKDKKHYFQSGIKARRGIEF